MRLQDIAHGRSGDKGNHSNIAVIVSQDDLVYEDANGLVDLFVWRAGGRAPRC